MGIRDCKIVAIEGTQASGKSTLAHAMVSYWREQGVHTGFADEAARSSPLIEEVLTGVRPTFDIACEVDLFAAQISIQVRVARLHQLVIADKTIANLLAYCKHVFQECTDSEAEIIAAMRHFCYAWSASYDAIILCQDNFDQHLESPTYKQPIFSYQPFIAKYLEDILADMRRPIIRVPLGLTTSQRLRHVVNELEQYGISRRTLG
jgi:predicted ATPase